MASSGTYDFSISNGEIALAAFERLKVFAPSIRNEHMQTARRELNFLLAEAANKQVNLWKVDLVTTTLVSGQEEYAVQPRTVMILDAWITLNANAPTSAQDHAGELLLCECELADGQHHMVLLVNGQVLDSINPVIVPVEKMRYSVVRQQSSADPNHWENP